MTANANDRERAIRERLAAATPGRWDWNHRYELHNTKAAIIEVEQIATGAHVLKVAQPDAALIANAPADLAYLLDRVAELTRERDSARTALEACKPLVDGEWRRDREQLRLGKFDYKSPDALKELPTADLYYSI